MSKRILSVNEIKTIYNNLAENYDASLWMFYVMGFRIEAYRNAAVEGLGLETGDTVIDLGCGTGLNFRMLKERIGPEGTIIGVDLSEHMLQQAQKKVDKSGCQNIELVQQDIADYSFPDQTDGILSTLALTMSPDYDQIIRRAANALTQDRCLSIFELKKPANWPDWVLKTMIWSLKSYGTRFDHTERTPWQSIEKYFPESNMKEYYFGATYVATGIA